MDESLKKLTENIINYHKKMNGRISWQMIPDEFTKEGNVTMLDTVRRYLVAREFIEYSGHDHAYTTLLKPGWDFTTFEDEERKDKEANRISRLTNEKTEVDLKNAKRVYKSYRTTRVLAWIGAISGLGALLLKLAEVLGIPHL